MIRNYFKIALRNLLRNKTASFINIFGLTVAIACSIVVFLFVKNLWTLDDFHANGDRIFIVEHVIERESGEQTWGTSPAMLGPALEAEFPQIERAVRVSMTSVGLTLGDNFFDESVYFADEGFFEMFTFPLKYGDKAALTDPNAIILSDRAAALYFPGQNPLGETINLLFENQTRASFIVKGVAEPFPSNIGFAFDLLMGFDARSIAGIQDTDSWLSMVRGTFIQVKEARDIDVIAQQMDKYAALYNAVATDSPVQRFVFDNLKNPADKAYNVYQRPAGVPHPAEMAVMILIAAVMMALSCFNYVNISLGSTARRLKEIGVRKVMGGAKGQLVFQFMTENLVLCMVALVFGVIITQAFLVPLFNSIMVHKISMAWAENLSLWVFLAGLLLFVAIASGAYPALYVASFQPVSIFQGKQSLHGKKGFTRVFLTLQFVLAFLSVILSVVTVSAGRNWVNQSWGYNPDETLVVRLRDAGRFELMRDAVLQDVNVQRVAGARHHIGEGFDHVIVGYPGDQEEVIRFEVGAGYIEAIGLRLREGRFFNEGQVSDKKAVVVNATYAAAEGWESVMGQSIHIDGEDYTVIGAVEDFSFSTMSFLLDKPVVLTSVDASRLGYMAIRYNAGASVPVTAMVEAHWKQLFPDDAFEHFKQSTVFDRFYESFNNIALIYASLAGLALLIACMGLFGLASQRFSARKKEVGVRKVLGASSGQIALLVNRSFLIMLLIAGFIATFLSYGGLQILVQTLLTKPLPFGVGPFIVGNLLVFASAMLAVGFQAFRLVQINPSTVLRNE